MRPAPRMLWPTSQLPMSASESDLPRNFDELAALGDDVSDAHTVVLTHGWRRANYCKLIGHTDKAHARRMFLGQQFGDGTTQTIETLVNLANPTDTSNKIQIKSSVEKIYKVKVGYDHCIIRSRAVFDPVYSFYRRCHLIFCAYFSQHGQYIIVNSGVGI